MAYTGGTKLKDGRVIENAYTSGQSKHDKVENTSNKPEYRIKKPNGSFEYTRDIKHKDIA